MLRKISILILLLFLFSDSLMSQVVQQTRGVNILRKNQSGERFLDYDNSWAILVGINDYKEWPDLSYAVNDVNSVKLLLTQQYGFDKDKIKVCLNKDASLDNIRSLLEGDFINQIKENDRLLFFWAGHGETRALVGGRERGYLVPYDGKKKDKENAYATYLSMDKIAQFSNFCAAKHILYLVDACYSGFAAATRGAMNLPEELQDYYLKLTQESGRQIITAGRKGEQVIESSEWGHSAFTTKLLRGLCKPFFAADQDQNGLITTKELAFYLEREVSKLTNGMHTPVYANLKGEGEFVFIRPDIVDLAEFNNNNSSNNDNGLNPYIPPEPSGRVNIPTDFTQFHKNEFIMGDTFGDGESNERPAHKVNVNDFYLLNHEVTNKDYFEFVRETNDHFPAWMQSVDPVAIKESCDWSFRQMGEALTGLDYPVVGVSWEDAQAYCQWLGAKNNVDGRLPMESEWEFAARLGGEAVKFTTGKDVLTNDDANLRDKGGKDTWKYTAPIGSFGENVMGISDMAGNVWEWCYDIHDGYGQPQSGERVIRGGGYDGFAWQSRATKRLLLPFSKGISNVGFRVVLTVPENVARKW